MPPALQEEDKRCPFPECAGRIFGDKRSREQHLASKHSEGWAYKCLICEKPYIATIEETLRKHVRKLHPGEETYLRIKIGSEKKPNATRNEGKRRSKPTPPKNADPKYRRVAPEPPSIDFGDVGVSEQNNNQSQTNSKKHNVTAKDVVNNNNTTADQQKTEKEKHAKPTAEQIRIAQITEIKSGIQLPTREMVSDVMEMTERSEDDACLALNECDNDVHLAVIYLLENPEGSALITTTKKKKNKAAAGDGAGDGDEFESNNHRDGARDGNNDRSRNSRGSNRGRVDGGFNRGRSRPSDSRDFASRDDRAGAGERPPRGTGPRRGGFSGGRGGRGGRLGLRGGPTYRDQNHRSSNNFRGNNNNQEPAEIDNWDPASTQVTSDHDYCSRQAVQRPSKIPSTAVELPGDGLHINVCKTCKGRSKNRWMIHCDVCQQRYHGACVGLRTTFLDQNNPWICHACSTGCQSIPHSTVEPNFPEDLRKIVDRIKNFCKISVICACESPPPGPNLHPTLARHAFQIPVRDFLVSFENFLIKCHREGEHIFNNGNKEDYQIIYATGARRYKYFANRAVLRINYSPDVLTDPKYEYFTASHLCPFAGCLQPQHIVFEDLTYNCSRRQCQAGVVAECFHSPRCILV